MISSAKPAATSTSSVSGSTAPATPGAAAPFDALFETLAATLTAQAPLGGSGLDGAGLEENPLEAGDDNTDDGAAIDAEDPLAFLASLLNAPLVTPAAQAGSADADSDDGVGDALAGPARHAVPLADLPISLTPQAGAGDPNAVSTNSGSAVDTASAQKFLSAIGQSGAADVNGARGDANQAPDANTAGLARAVEMMNHGTRHAPAAHDVIATPARDPNWAQDFSARVTMLVRGGESTASLQMTPADLGPMDVSVTVRDSQATIHFGAAQAETRALIEASIPRLREMLAAQGFNLMDASVSHGFSRQARGDATALVQRDSAPEAEVHATSRITAAGLLDLYA